jgi:hypothetical protein
VAHHTEALYNHVEKTLSLSVTVFPEHSLDPEGDNKKRLHLQAFS